MYENLTQDEVILKIKNSYYGGKTLRSWKNNRDIILEVINSMSLKMRCDKELMSKLINIDANFLIFAGKNLKNDKELALQAVIKNGNLLNNLDNKLKNDKDVVFEAIKQGGSINMFIMMGNKVIKDTDFLNKLLNMVDIDVTDSNSNLLKKIMNNKDYKKIYLELYGDEKNLGRKKWIVINGNVIEVLRNQLLKKEMEDEIVLKKTKRPKKIKF